MSPIRVTRMQLADKPVREGATIKAYLDLEVTGLFLLTQCALVHYEDRNRFVIWRPSFEKRPGLPTPIMNLTEPVLAEMRRVAGEAYSNMIRERPGPSAEDIGLPMSLMRPAA